MNPCEAKESDLVDLKTCVSLCYFIPKVCHFLSSDTGAPSPGEAQSVVRLCWKREVTWITLEYFNRERTPRMCL